MEQLKQHVWATDETELKELIDTGYAEIYMDVSLSVIYEELMNCFDNENVDQKIDEQFGYYGLSVLLYVCGTYYWLMQV